MAKKWIEGDDLSPDNLNRTGGYAEVVLPTMSLTEINTVLQTVASDGGGTVAFRNGLYEFAGDLVIPSNVGIIGESFGGTILQFTGNYGINGSGVFVYNTGTVSATKGSNQIVGSGTSWSANLTVGEEILIDGFYYEIASVVDDENLTITRPYPYESISDISYVVANPTTSITITDFFITNTTPLNGYGIKLEYNKFSFLRRNAMIVVGEAYILKDCSIIGINDTGINICDIGFDMDNAGSIAIQEVSGDCVTANIKSNECKRCYASDIGAYSADKGLTINKGYRLNFNSIWSGDNTTGIEIKNSLETNITNSFVFGNTTGLTIDSDCERTKIASTSFENTTNITDSGVGTVISGCTNVNNQGDKVLRVYDTVGNHNWTKPERLKYIEVEIWGGGGGGRWGDSSHHAAGGGGAYNRKIIKAEDLGATEIVTVGAGGVGSGSSTSGGSGGTGGTTSFGTHLYAYGGVGGFVTHSSDFSVGGRGGGQLPEGAPGFPTVGFGKDSRSETTVNMNSVYGGAGGGEKTYGAGGRSLYGGGGGSCSGSGGLSVHGGNGGAAGANDGNPPGGGGGASNSASGSGARGEVRIIEYF